MFIISGGEAAKPTVAIKVEPVPLTSTKATAASKSSTKTSAKETSKAPAKETSKSKAASKATPPAKKKAAAKKSKQSESKNFSANLNGNVRINRKKKVVMTQQEILLDKFKGPFVRIEGDLTSPHWTRVVNSTSDPLSNSDERTMQKPDLELKVRAAGFGTHSTTLSRYKYILFVIVLS